MLTITDILQAQNGFKQEDKGNKNTTGNIIGSFQSGLNLADLIKNAGILGGSGAGATAAAVPPVPPVV